jgi:hypothetical protein
MMRGHMPKKTFDIFISYARHDQQFADQLEHDLQAAGYTTWMDRSRLEGGQNWRRELEQAIDHSQAIVVVLTPASVASVNVGIETNHAIQEHKPIIPLLYHPCKIPMELSIFQTVPFDGLYETGLQALCNTLRAHALLPHPPLTPPSAVSSPPPSPVISQQAPPSSQALSSVQIPPKLNDTISKDIHQTGGKRKDQISVASWITGGILMSLFIIVVGVSILLVVLFFIISQTFSSF